MKNSEYYRLKLEQEYDLPEEEQDDGMVEHYATLKQLHERAEATAVADDFETE